MTHYSVALTDVDLRAIRDSIATDISVYFDQQCDKIWAALGEFAPYLGRVVFSTAHDFELALNEVEVDGDGVTSGFSQSALSSSGFSACFCSCTQPSLHLPQLQLCQEQTAQTRSDGGQLEHGELQGQQQCQQRADRKVEVIVNPLRFNDFTEQLHKQFIQTFIASLSQSDDIFDICIKQLNYCSRVLNRRLPISLRVAPSFCDGTPKTLRQLKPHKVQSLISLLSNTFLSIQSSQIQCMRQARQYCVPCARVIDATGVLSGPMQLLDSSELPSGQLNGSYLGILAQVINFLADGSQDLGCKEQTAASKQEGKPFEFQEAAECSENALFENDPAQARKANVPEIFRQLLKHCLLSISLDDQVPEYYTNGSENVLQDYLPQRIHLESGGGDAGSFLDAPGNCVPVCHFLLAEQSTQHQFNIMSVQEVWIRICLKTAPPSAYLKIMERFDDSPFAFPEQPQIILQISSIPANRKEFFEYFEDSAGTMAVTQQTDVHIIPGDEAEMYYFQDVGDNVTYKMPGNLLHAHEISQVFRNEKPQNFQSFLYGAFLISLISSLQQYYGNVFKYVIAADLNYSAAKLKLLIRDPNYVRYNMQKLFQGINANEDVKYKQQDFAFDVLSLLISQRKIILPNDKYDIKYQFSNSYGRAMVRKQNLSNYALFSLFRKVYCKFLEISRDKMVENSVFVDLVDKMLIQNEQCKFAIDDVLKFNQDVFFTNGMSDSSAQCLNYYNIVVQDCEQFLAPEIEQEIVLCNRFGQGDQESENYVRFMNVALHQKRVITMFPEMITVNGIGLINDQISRQRSILQLDLGFVSPLDRAQLYLFYQQTYPLVIKELSKQLTEYLTLKFSFAEHDLAFIPDPQIKGMTRNAQYRNSSYYIMSHIWQLFSNQKIIISRYLENHDYVDVFQERDRETTLVLRIVTAEEGQHISRFVDSEERPCYAQLVNDFLSFSLMKEYNLVFSDRFCNLQCCKTYKMVNSTTIFAQLLRKLNLSRLVHLMEVGRGYQKYLLPLISSETSIIIPRHYPFLKTHLDEAFQHFVVQFAECNFAGLQMHPALRTHFHRIFNTCAFVYFGVAQESCAYVSAITEFDMKFRRGRLSVFVDTRSCEQIVRRAEGGAEVFGAVSFGLKSGGASDFQPKEGQKAAQKSPAAPLTLEECRRRLQAINPIMLYYLKQKQILYCLLERRNGYYYFIVDNKFRLAVLAVPVDLYLTEFSQQLFSREQYSQNAGCIISDSDILLENNQLVVQFSEQAIGAFSASGDAAHCQKEFLYILRQFRQQQQFLNLKLAALRFFLNDIDALFRYQIRSYAHLQSFWGMGFASFCKDAFFMYQVLKNVARLPLTLARAVNARHETHFREKRVCFPLNILLIDGKLEPARSFSAVRYLQAALRFDINQYNRQIPLDQFLSLKIPATVISQHDFTMLDEIDAERVPECAYEAQYARAVDALAPAEASESGSQFCIAEPSFCGYLLVLSARREDWEACYELHLKAFCGELAGAEVEVGVGVEIGAEVGAETVHGGTGGPDEVAAEAGKTVEAGPKEPQQGAAGMAGMVEMAGITEMTEMTEMTEITEMAANQKENQLEHKLEHKLDNEKADGRAGKTSGNISAGPQTAKEKEPSPRASTFQPGAQQLLPFEQQVSAWIDQVIEDFTQTALSGLAD